MAYRSVGARGFIEILIPRLAVDKNGYVHEMPFELEVCVNYTFRINCVFFCMECSLDD